MGQLGILMNTKGSRWSLRFSFPIGFQVRPILLPQDCTLNSEALEYYHTLLKHELKKSSLELRYVCPFHFLEDVYKRMLVTALFIKVNIWQ
jgi:hypothetical protein